MPFLLHSHPEYQEEEPMADYLVVNVVREDAQGKKRWNRVGVAFPNKLGGFNVKMDVPVAAMEYVIAPPLEKKDRPSAPAADDFP